MRQVHLFILVILSSAAVWAHQVPTERPSILNLSPQAHDLGEDWEKVKASQVSFVLELMHVYPDRELYFLARDAELLYDTALLLSEKYPQLRDRVHLLNVSRSSLTSLNLPHYLKQEGISNEDLASGKKLLFVDTGYAGTIPLGILGLINRQYRSQIQTHLISSADARIPNSLVFTLGWTDKKNLADRVTDLESMVRHANTAVDYQFHQGRWHAVAAEKPSYDDPPANPEEARKYQEDLLQSFRAGQFDRKIEIENQLWKELLPLFYNSWSVETKIEKIKTFLKGDHSALREAMVRDMTEITLMTQRSSPYVSGIELGLNPFTDSPISLAHVIDTVPHFKDILFEPEVRIPLLFKESNYAVIRDLYYSVEDHITAELISKGLVENSSHPAVQSLLKDVVSSRSDAALFEVIRSVLSQPNVHNQDSLIRSVLERNDKGFSYHLIRHVLSQDHLQNRSQFVETILDDGDPAAMAALVRFVFSKPHAMAMEDQLNRLIAEGDRLVLNLLGEFVFQKPFGQRATGPYQLFGQRLRSLRIPWQWPIPRAPQEFQACQDILSAS